MTIMWLIAIKYFNQLTALIMTKFDQWVHTVLLMLVMFQFFKMLKPR